MRKCLMFSAALVVMSGSAWAETSEFACPSGSASTLHCFTCGNDCTMTLDTATGHAVISGTGEMEGKNGNSGGNAWNTYNSYFRTVEIKDGIESIGNSAFKFATNLTDVVIADTVTKIEANAFENTHSLTNVKIPNSVKSIGDWAFQRTYSLTELVIPDSVEKLGYAAFADGSGIRTLTIPDHLILESLRPSDVSYGAPNRTFEFAYAANVICSGGGDTAKCDALLKQGGKNIQSTSRPNYRLDENGNIIEIYQYDAEGNRTSYTLDERVNKYDEEGNLVSYTKSNADGSIYTYDADGNVKSIRGKRIYTVEEAKTVTAHGDKFHVGITYK